MRYLVWIFVIAIALIFTFVAANFPPCGMIFDPYKTIYGQFLGGLVNLECYLLFIGFMGRQ